MTSTRVASARPAVTAASQPRPEALESWAEGRIKPRARGRPATGPARAANDFFVTREGVRYAGTHLLVDLWGATQLDDLALAESTLREAVDAVGASLLNVHLHQFTPNGGVSGVAVLAESHISIHTWPENGYAALDVFMCGAARPHEAIEVLRNALRPARLAVSEHLRGRMP